MTAPRLIAAALALALLPQVSAAQERRLYSIGEKQCAIPDTDLYDYLETAIPDCETFCLVDRGDDSLRPADVETMIFQCEDEDGAGVPPPGNGLRAGAAALGILGLLLSTSGGGGENQVNSANNTTGGAGN